MTSKDYWETRALQREAEAYDDAADAILRLRRLYDDSARRLSDSAKLIFNAYLKASGIDEQQARQLLSIQETAELLDQLRKEYADTGGAAALAKLNAPAYAYRINRVQALRKAVEAETTALAEREQRIGELQLVRTYDAGYYKTMYDAAASENGTDNFAVLPQGAVDEAILTRWKGANYSERVWKDREITATEAGKIIESGVAAGKSVYSMSRELADLLNSASYVAERLIRTETNRIHNDASLAAYAAMGSKEYRYLATLDARTCAVCGVLDGKHFKVADAKTGVNFPPMHPNDRCTTVAYDPEENTDGTRTARDPETGRNYKIPGGVTYEQWRRDITEKYGADALEKARQRITYKKSDAAQLAGLKKVLGKDAPEDLAAFQNLKYNEPEKWEDVKYYARHINGRPIAYVKIDRELEKLGITQKGRAYPPEPIEIKGWRDHAEKRLSQRGLTKEQAADFMLQAKIMMKQYPEPATLFNYYSEDGILGVKADSRIVQTTFGKDDFMSDTLKIFEVIKKYVK